LLLPLKWKMILPCPECANSFHKEPLFNRALRSDIVGNTMFCDSNTRYCNVDGLDPRPRNNKFQDASFQEMLGNKSKTVFPTLVSTQFSSDDLAGIPTVAPTVYPTNQIAAHSTTGSQTLVPARSPSCFLQDHQVIFRNKIIPNLSS
jgi:hypothetical protein